MPVRSIFLCPGSFECCCWVLVVVAVRVLLFVLCCMLWWMHVMGESMEEEGNKRQEKEGKKTYKQKHHRGTGAGHFGGNNFHVTLSWRSIVCAGGECNVGQSNAWLPMPIRLSRLLTGMTLQKENREGCAVFSISFLCLPLSEHWTFVLSAFVLFFRICFSSPTTVLRHQGREWENKSIEK